MRLAGSRRLGWIVAVGVSFRLACIFSRSAASVLSSRTFVAFYHVRLAALYLGFGALIAPMDSDAALPAAPRAAAGPCRLPFPRGVSFHRKTLRTAPVAPLR
jgi:hypothetical protein